MNGVKLSDFTGRNDCELFERAMEYLRLNPDTELYVEPRVYEIGTELSRRTMEDVLCGAYGENPEGIMFSPDFAYSEGVSLEGQRGSIIHAQGATLLIDGFMEPLTLKNCENITVCGLTIDHKRKPYSMGRIVAQEWSDKAAGNGSLIVEFGAEYPMNEKIPMPRYALYDVYANRLVHYDEYRMVGREYLGENRFRILVEGMHFDAVGMDFTVWHTFHYRPAILIENAVNTVLKNVTINSQPGMGIVAHRSRDIYINGLRVVPSVGAHLSTNTDATHFTSCKGTVRIENSVFDGQGDDSVNIHTFYHTVERTGEKTCMTHLQSPTRTHSQTADYPDEGDVLELTDMNSLRVAEIYRVKSCKRGNTLWESELILDKALPEDCTGMAFANATQSARLEFVNNFCRSHLARSILVKTKQALVEGNTVMDVVGTGIYVAAEAWWYEGICTTEDIVIRRNRVLHCGRTDNGARKRGSGGICVTIDAPRPDQATHRHVVIEDNDIDCPDAPHGIYVSNCKEAVVNRNRVVSADESVVIEASPARK